MQRLNLREVLSQNIRAFRAREGLSQDEFAARCGLHRTYIGSVERKERNITLETLSQISASMGIPVSELLTPSTGKDSAGD
jgi:transcriptional regulator with XRE-family HTH domain